MNKTFIFLLAGGRGKRLGALTRSRPKPLVPFAGQYRLIDFPLSNAFNAGAKHLGILVQPDHTDIIEYFNQWTSAATRNKGLSWTALPALTSSKYPGRYFGTADAVRRNVKLFDDDPECQNILVLAADHIYKMDYNDIISYHRRKAADVTIAVTNVSTEQTFQLGIACCDHHNKIVDWQEKPVRADSTTASMGIYVFSKQFLLRALEKSPGHDFGHHIIPFAVQHAQCYAYTFNDYWRDVGTPGTYWQSVMDMLNTRRDIALNRWGIKSVPSGALTAHFRTVYGHSNAQIEHSIVSTGCQLNGSISNSVISAGVRTGENVRIDNSIILDNCTIASNAAISNAVLCQGVYVGKNCSIGAGQNSSGQSKPGGPRENGPVIIDENVLIKPDENLIHSRLLSCPLIRSADFEKIQQLYTAK